MSLSTQIQLYGISRSSGVAVGAVAFEKGKTPAFKKGYMLFKNITVRVLLFASKGFSLAKTVDI